MFLKKEWKSDSHLYLQHRCDNVEYCLNNICLQCQNNYVYIKLTLLYMIKTFHFDFLRIFNTSTQKKKVNEKIKSQSNLIFF